MGVLLEFALKACAVKFRLVSPGDAFVYRTSALLFPVHFEYFAPFTLPWRRSKEAGDAPASGKCSKPLWHGLLQHLHHVKTHAMLA